RAGRADHEAAASLEDERLVRRRRVEARFRSGWFGLGEAVGLACPARNLLDQARLGLARLVRIDLGTRVMRPDLQAVDGVGKRVHVMGVAVRLEGDQRRNRSAVLGPEVADGLARDLDGQRLLEQLVDPRAGRDDDYLGVEFVRMDAGSVADVEIAAES